MSTKTFLTISLTLTALAFLISGCSSSVKSFKQLEAKGDKNPEQISPMQTDRNSMESRPFQFPVKNDLHDACYFQTLFYDLYLVKAIRLYRRVMGTYPDSMSSFVQSRFPIHWPRNVMTGAPVGVLIGRTFNLDSTDLGLIQWEKYDDDHAKLTYVDLDYKSYRNTGLEKWVERSIEFKWWKKWETWNGEAYEYQLRSRREGHPADTEWAIDIMGGTMPINDVLSKENRMIYGICAQLSDHVCGSSGWVYFPDERFVLPATFRDLYNEGNLIILENFANFSNLLENSGADFRIGFDYSKRAQYSWLKIGDETLIALCRIHNPNSEDGLEKQYNGIQYDNNGENVDPNFSGFWSMADMSTPMITVNNIAQIQIPNEIVISIENIPIGN